VNEDADASPCNGDIISSVGVDFNTTSPATPANVIGSLSFAWTSAVAWNGTANGAYSGGNNGNWTGAKAVDVPVNATPAYDTTGGAIPTNTYRVGALSVVGGTRFCTFAAGTHVANSTYTLKMAVNNLLITRTCSSGGDAGGFESVSLGYGDPSGASGCGATPEAGINGSDVNSINVAPDAVIVVQMKGDFNGSGNVTTQDQGGWVAARNAGAGVSQRDLYLGDFNGAGNVTTQDQGGWVNARNNTACPP
jgi:hypothetical protein